MDDFKTFPATPIALDFADTTVELSPLRLGELPRFLAIVRPFAESLTAEPDWADLLARHGEAVLELLALTTRRERVWIDGLSLDDAVRLSAAVFEVNADFFVAHVVPAVQVAARRLEPTLRALPGTAGTTPSPA
jgi:hypothetical protein